MATKLITEATAADVRRILESIETPRPNGPALAAILASGIGSAVLGVVTTAAVASAALRTTLTLNPGVGTLSGKAAVAVAAFAVSWAIMALVMRGKHYAARPFFIATFVLIAIGVIGTFPLFFDRFAP